MSGVSSVQFSSVLSPFLSSSGPDCMVATLVLPCCHKDTNAERRYSHLWWTSVGHNSWPRMPSVATDSQMDRFSGHFARRALRLSPVLQAYLPMFESLQALCHIQTVIQSLSKDDALPESAFFDVLVPSRSECLSCQLRL